MKIMKEERIFEKKYVATNPKCFDTFHVGKYFEK